MSMQKRKFTKEEKLAILEESKVYGVKATIEKHGIYSATFYSWNRIAEATEV